MANAPSRALVGTVLSQRWRLIQKLGDGGMGVVYAAESVAGGGRVAVKLLAAEFLGDSLVLARFAEAGRTCLHLIHPNIARVFECSMAEDGAPYMVMDLLEGVPLSAYTQNGGRVPVAQAVPIVQGILGGLGAAHAQGVVHRNLKPDNVFLVRNSPGTFAVKLLDFGIASVMDAAGGMGNRTRSGMFLGTPAYMSPEQIQQAGAVDQRTDLFSAGVILYELVTGRAAFPAPTEYARLAAVVSSEPEPIDRIDPTLAPLAPVVARALQKNRQQRFTSALEMAHALAAVSPNDSMRPDGSITLEGPSATVPLSRVRPAPSVIASSAVGHPAMSVLARTTPAPEPASPRPGRHKPGGTLESAAQGLAIVDTGPEVRIATITGTLPSKDIPIIAGRGRGVPRLIVVALVASALAAGFLLGWAAARMG